MDKSITQLRGDQVEQEKGLELNRTIGINDNATGTVTDTGENISIPVEITTTAGVSNSTQLPAGKNPLRIFGQRVLDNLSYLFGNAITSLQQGSNVTISGSGNTRAISVTGIDLPDKFSSTQTGSGAIGSSFSGMTLVTLTGINTQASPKVRDVVIFSNGYQAEITSISGVNWSGIIISTPVATSWGAISGTLVNQTDLNSALSGKEPLITGGTASQYWRGDKSWQTLNNSAVGLGNVPNEDWKSANLTVTADVATNGTIDTDSRTSGIVVHFNWLRQKINWILGVSGLGAKANIASPNFSGIPTAPTAIPGTNTTQIATTAFVQNALPNVGDGIITLQQGGSTKGTFTTNQAGNTTINFDAGGVTGNFVTLDTAQTITSTKTFDGESSALIIRDINANSFPKIVEIGKVLYNSSSYGICVRSNEANYAYYGSDSIKFYGGGFEAGKLYSSSQFVFDGWGANGNMTTAGEDINKIGKIVLTKDVVSSFPNEYIRADGTFGIPGENNVKDQGQTGTPIKWIVPANETYTFEIAGAGGSASDNRYYLMRTNRGGYGRKMTVTQSLLAGEVLTFVIGKMPVLERANTPMSDATSGGGGGGTFVFRDIDSILDSRFQFVKAGVNGHTFEVLMVANGGGGTTDLNYSTTPANGPDAATMNATPSSFTAHNSSTASGIISNSYSDGGSISQYIMYDAIGGMYSRSNTIRGGYGCGGVNDDQVCYGGGWHKNYNWLLNGAQVSASSDNAGGGYVIIKDSLGNVIFSSQGGISKPSMTAWGGIIGTMTNQTDLNNALNILANKKTINPASLTTPLTSLEGLSANQLDSQWMGYRVTLSGNITLSNENTSLGSSNWVNGQELLFVINGGSSSRTITIPAGTGYMTENGIRTVTIPANQVIEMSVLRIDASTWRFVISNPFY